ncbi:MAG: cbb3-type cytochrome c oxidase subunit II [Acidimicrobiia bacterium]|nr:cbb3-type cytochrome c oxidase subunit II [Acidimicrobiia bacterium]
MSKEVVDVLAERFGASAALIQRSAAARASAQGAATEAVLNAWAGGSPPPAASTPAVVEAPESMAITPEPVEVEATDQPESEEAVVRPEPEAVPAEAPPAPTPLAAAVLSAPVAMDEPAPMPGGTLSSLLLGAIALFAIMFFAAVIAPASAGNAQVLDAVDPIVLSAGAEHGRDVYLAQGCAFCHTQQVRPVVTDADLGIVTLSGSPLVPGLRRNGPDLTHIGSRPPTDDPVWLTGYLEDPEALRAGSKHASFGYLSAGDIEDLVDYLLESK